MSKTIHNSNITVSIQEYIDENVTTPTLEQVLISGNSALNSITDVTEIVNLPSIKFDGVGLFRIGSYSNYPYFSLREDFGSPFTIFSYPLMYQGGLSSITAESAAGTGGSLSINVNRGSFAAGNIYLTTGNGASSGKICTIVNDAQCLDSDFMIYLTAKNSNAADIQVYGVSISTTSWELYCKNSLADSTDYRWSYFTLSG